MKNKNKTIGILGGMGPQASSKLLEIIIAIASRDYGAKNGSDFPEIVLNSIPVPDFISKNKNINKAADMLKVRVKALENFNPSCFGIACNTAHVLIKDLQTETNIPFVSMIEDVGKKVYKTKIKRVGLIGTPITIRSRLYQTALEKYEIKTITPLLKNSLTIESVIRNVLAGEVNKLDINKLIFVAESLRLKGAQGIILGCTELPLIFPKEFSIPIFDSIEILANAMLRKAYE